MIHYNDLVITLNGRIGERKRENKMDFETFRENLARDIKETLEARSGSDFEVEHRTAEKMNGNYEAIVVKPADSEVGVSLNASTLYMDYESGVSYETIAKGATDLADRSLRNQPEFDVDSFKDYDKMKGRQKTSISGTNNPVTVDSFLLSTRKRS